MKFHHSSIENSIDTHAPSNKNAMGS